VGEKITGKNQFAKRGRRGVRRGGSATVKVNRGRDKENSQSRGESKERKEKDVMQSKDKGSRRYNRAKVWHRNQDLTDGLKKRKVNQSA